MCCACCARRGAGHDVFNALDIFENEKILKGGCAGGVGALMAVPRRCVGPGCPGCRHMAPQPLLAAGLF